MYEYETSALSEQVVLGERIAMAASVLRWS